MGKSTFASISKDFFYSAWRPWCWQSSHGNRRVHRDALSKKNRVSYCLSLPVKKPRGLIVAYEKCFVNLRRSLAILFTTVAAKIYNTFCLCLMHTIERIHFAMTEKLLSQHFLTLRMHNYRPFEEETAKKKGCKFKNISSDF